jgi:nitroreductase
MTPESHDPSHHGIDDSSARRYPNEAIRLLIERSSCRSFSEQKIPAEIMNLVLEAGIHAATGGNLQPYSIIKVEDEQTKQKLAALNEDQMFITTAPVNLVFCIDWHRIERWAELEKAPFTADRSFRHFWISFQDTIIAAQNICTAADALGLGSVYVGTVLECFREIKELLGLPRGVFPVVLLSLGYPKVRPLPKRKLPVAVVVHNEGYKELSDDQLCNAFETKYPDWKKEITPERLETIAHVCRETEGEEFAHRCVETIKRAGHINAVQNYFGLHYRADIMPQRNDEFMQIVRDFGFGWFERYTSKT